MDRFHPTLRPPRQPIGYQNWRDLLFLHWSVPESRLRPLVPKELDLDTFHGKAYVGLIPFRTIQGRPRGLPARLGMDFLETNFRTYVHVRGRDPGVYFFSLDAASVLGVLGARAAFGLNYYYARMSFRADQDEVHYKSQRLAPSGAALELRYRVGPTLPSSQPGTLAFFLIERYLLYVAEHGKIWSGQVHHEPYPLREARVLSLSQTISRAHGAGELARPPDHVHYSEGVDVEIFALKRYAR